MDTLILVDVMDSHGMMLSRQRFVLEYPGKPVVIGRDLACDVVLNDPYVAARHAALYLRQDGTVNIDDVGTVNGLIVADERVRHATVAGLDGAHVQVGHSHLRLRTAAEPLAPELPDLESLRSKHREYAAAALGALACAGFAGFTAWVGSPDDVPNAFVGSLVRGIAVVAGWFALWVLLGRAVRSRWQWTGNAAVTLGAAALMLWLWWGTEVAVFATGSARLRLLGIGLILLVAAGAIYLQVRAATRLRRRGALAIATVLPLVGVVAWLWLLQSSGADINRVVVPPRIFPPTWSRQAGVRLDRFFDEGMDLRDAANIESGAGRQD